MMSGSLLRGLRLLPARPAVSRGWGGGASARGRGREAGGTANRPAGPGDGQRVRSGAVRVAPGRTRRVEVGDRPPGGPRELSAAAPSPHPGPGRGGGGGCCWSRYRLMEERGPAGTLRRKRSGVKGKGHWPPWLMASTGDMEASGSYPFDGFSFSLGALHASRPATHLRNIPP